MENRGYNAHMDYQFRNQLTNKEILVGLFFYVNHKYRLFFIIFAVVIFAVTYICEGIQFLIVNFIITILAISIFELIIILFLKCNFSVSKIATYILHDDNLKIINSIGKVYVFKYSQIRVLEHNHLFILLLSDKNFALVSKRNLSKEQVTYLKKLS